MKKKSVYVSVIAIQFILMNVRLHMMYLPEIDWISDVYAAADDV